MKVVFDKLHCLFYLFTYKRIHQEIIILVIVMEKKKFGTLYVYNSVIFIICMKFNIIRIDVVALSIPLSLYHCLSPNGIAVCLSTFFFWIKKKSFGGIFKIQFQILWVYFYVLEAYLINLNDKLHIFRFHHFRCTLDFIYTRTIISFSKR